MTMQFWVFKSDVVESEGGGIRVFCSRSAWVSLSNLAY
jgi:hypothetical protein